MWLRGGWGGDVNVLRTCTHPGCYATAFFVHTNTLDVTHLVQIDTPVSVLSNKLDATAVMGWGGVGMLTFLELAHILDATQLRFFAHTNMLRGLP